MMLNLLGGFLEVLSMARREPERTGAHELAGELRALDRAPPGSPVSSP